MSYLIQRREDRAWWVCYDSLSAGDTWAPGQIQAHEFPTLEAATDEAHWLIEPVDIVRIPDPQPPPAIRRATPSVRRQESLPTVQLALF